VTVYFGVSIWQILRDAVRELRAGRSVAISAILLRIAMLFIIMIITYVLVTFVVLLAVLSATPTDQYGSGAFPSPDYTSNQDTAAQLAAMTQVVGAISFMLVLFGLPVVANLWTQAQLHGLRPGRYPAAPRPSPRFDQLHYQLSGNTVVYGEYSPFVGAGQYQRGWSIAQRLVHPQSQHGDQPEADREFTVPPFTAVELIAQVRARLRSLAFEATPEGLLPGLTVEDRVFVSGTEISQLTAVTPPEDVARIITDPTTPERHYLVCQVVSWRGELVTTVYIHVALQGKALYLELITMALPPCRRAFRVVDLVDGTGPMAYLRAFGRGLAFAPVTVASAPVNLARAAFDGIVNSMATAAATTAVARGYDYGAVVGVRELGMADDVRSHLQAQDIIKYSQVIERRLVAAVLDFLEAKGVDTGEFVERTMNVLNAGVVNNGSGNVNVGGDAVGSQQNKGPAAPGGRR
jgi:hypothetical protein